MSGPPIGAVDLPWLRAAWRRLICTDSTEFDVTADYDFWDNEPATEAPTGPTPAGGALPSLGTEGFDHEHAPS
jgi:hypothetical protein